MTQRINQVLFALIIFFLAVIMYSCGTFIKPYYAKEQRNWQEIAPPDSANIKYTVFLIGDAGDPAGKPVLQLLNRHLKAQDTLITTDVSGTASLNDTIVENKSNPNDAVVFMGDNIYYFGLPEEDASDREEKEEIINRQMDALKGFKGEKFFIPGNHDWNKSHEGGLEAVLRLEDYVESYGDSTIRWLPNRGCPGPYELLLNEDLVILFVDTEWYLTKQYKPQGPENNCYVEDRFDFMVQLEDAVQRNSNKNILIVQHHPLFSNSNHGGHYSLKDNIFPLTLVRDNLYIPLPLIGSLYPLLRKYGVSRQDIPNPVYQNMIREMLSIIEDQGNVVVASGHDHNLQLIQHQEMSQIVSGSGGKTNFAARRGGATFVQQRMGFSKINYYDNGEVWAEFWTIDEEDPNGKISFRAPLYALNPQEEEDLKEKELIDYTDSTITVVAGSEYEAGKFKEFWLGEHYRDVWATPVEVPYLDMKTEAGGLTPIQKGGGNQTVSLRVMNPDSIQYNLRSINKNPRGAIPSPLFNTIAEDLVKDQISTAHPYGAFALTKMSEALSLFHTDPKLFYIPTTPLLGPYIDDFGGMLVMSEIRPDEDLSEFKRFGYSENVVSTRTLFRNLREDNDNEVDDRMYLKNRMFDMLINDWDRHEDQWRWSEFEKEDKGSIYKPVPRDRDQVFTKFDGVIPYLVTRRWAIRKFNNFGHEVEDVIGLNDAAKLIDRKLLTNLSKDSWMEIADSIQLQLTDEVIEASMSDLPPEVYEISGPEIAEKLKSRRDALNEFTLDYYEVLAKNVNVVSSNKHEYFKVERLNDKETRVRAYKTKKEGNVKDILYDRTFTTDETDEVRIYALDGMDSVVITGEAASGVTVRVIGGTDEDVIIDNSKGGKVYIYDKITEDNRIKPGESTRLKLSKKDYVNEYNPDNFKYDYLGPRLFIEYNRDNGIYLGGGVYKRTHGFRKNPKAEHSLLANYAFNTSSFTLKYEGTLYSLFGRNWDLNFYGTGYGPKFVFNYFGQGNSTPGENEIEGVDIDYFRISMNRVEIVPTIQRRFTEFFKMGFGLRFDYFDVLENSNTIINNAEVLDPDQVNEQSYFGGLNFFTQLDLKNHPVHPTRGVKWINNINYNHELNNGGKESVSLNTDASFYISPNLPFEITAAVRLGGAHNFGSFNFYQSNFIGGTSNLRGYRQTRFAGRSTAFTNTELRLELFPVRNYVLNGTFGVTGFVDVGRVWSDVANESRDWHRGYGPGIWLQFYELLLISADYGISEEGNFFNFRFGHFF